MSETNRHTQGKKVYALCSCCLSFLYATQHICNKAWLNTLTAIWKAVKVNVPKWRPLILYMYYYSPMYYIFCYTDCAVWVSVYPMYIWMLRGWWLPQWYSAEMSCHGNNCWTAEVLYTLQPLQGCKSQLCFQAFSQPFTLTHWISVWNRGLIWDKYSRFTSIVTHGIPLIYTHNYAEKQDKLIFCW